MTDQKGLEPCPFCGSNRITVLNIRDGQEAVCKDCKATAGPEFYGPNSMPSAHERAVAAWNRRSTTPDIAPVAPEAERDRPREGLEVFLANLRAREKWLVAHHNIQDAIRLRRAANYLEAAEHALNRLHGPPSVVALVARAEKAEAALSASPEAPKVPGGEMDGVSMIAAERSRQIDAEGWTLEHDDTHANGEMARAGGLYALFAGSGATDYRNVCGGFAMGDFFSVLMKEWPWNKAWFKPTNRCRDLVKAGALIAAEIDRLLRKEALASRGPAPVASNSEDK